ncbi:MAG: TAXI family TRAP transporter solute-binding subunit [Reyranellales bacterium]
MKHVGRRETFSLLAATAGLASTARRAQAQAPSLSLMTAGAGSVFLPYGQGIAKVLADAGIRIEIRESKGSNENLDGVEASPGTLGAAFLGSALDALNGTGFAAGKPHRNVRALFPMYETAFMAAALASRGLATIKSLDGRKVGCGPAAGPAEDYFRAVAAIAGIKPTIASGTPAAQAKQLLAGEIDAFWQGAFVPIPSLVSVTKAADCTVFGLSDAEVAGMGKRYPFMADAAYPSGTYRGQKAGLKTVAAWNAVVAHKDLNEGTAYAVTKAVLTAKDLSAAGPPAASTRAANATKNKVVPYHPGAIRALAELGVKVG